MKTLIMLLTCLGLCACSHWQLQAELPSAGTLNCSEAISRLDELIDTHTHFDPALRRLPGFPLLRSNRFLASFAQEVAEQNAYNDLIGRLNRLAQDAYLSEFARLPATEQMHWQQSNGNVPVSEILQKCSTAYIGQLQTSPPLHLDELQPPDNYSVAQRVLGVYPLTRLLARGSIAQYRAEMTARINSGDSRAITSVRAYQPDAEVSSSTPMDVLFHQHAPLLRIEHQTVADIPGFPGFDSDKRININTQTPSVFTYATQTRFQQQTLLQLNYVFWFAERPKEKTLDLYGGPLDALIWRVTLDANGRPILYDSIHGCGCYHLLFLPSGTQINWAKIADEKPLAFPIQRFTAQQRPVLGIEGGTHYLVSVSSSATHRLETPAASVDYAFHPYDQLLHLPVAEGHKSLFGNTGIIEQSARLERFILWPLGVPNAGAMRQAGMHAIAFVGRRHFDNPWLLDELGISVLP